MQIVVYVYIYIYISSRLSLPHFQNSQLDADPAYWLLERPLLPCCILHPSHEAEAAADSLRNDDFEPSRQCWCLTVSHYNTDTIVVTGGTKILGTVSWPYFWNWELPSCWGRVCRVVNWGWRRRGASLHLSNYLHIRHFPWARMRNYVKIWPERWASMTLTGFRVRHPI